MSEKSWFDEFYPITASDTTGLPTKDIIQHSLTKWLGLTKESLEKHGLDRPPIGVDSDTCSLCVNFVKPDCGSLNPCTNCPLFISRYGVSCTDLKPTETISPFNTYVYSRDPLPMISELQNCLSLAIHQSSTPPKSEETPIPTTSSIIEQPQSYARLRYYIVVPCPPIQGRGLHIFSSRNKKPGTDGDIFLGPYLTLREAKDILSTLKLFPY